MISILGHRRKRRKEAVQAYGPERQRWLQVAQAWLELDRWRPEPDRRRLAI